MENHEKWRQTFSRKRMSNLDRCWRYRGLTGIERPAYDFAISVGLPSEP